MNSGNELVARILGNNSGQVLKRPEVKPTNRQNRTLKNATNLTRNIDQSAFTATSDVEREAVVFRMHSDPFVESPCALYAYNGLVG